MQQQQDQWVAATDEASGAQYWYNPATLETAWERPQAAAAPAATDVPATPAGIDERGNTNPLGIPYLPNGGRMGQLLPARSAAEQKNMLKGGKDGLMAVRCVCVSPTARARALDTWCDSTGAPLAASGAAYKRTHTYTRVHA